jgi:hypothetical protein
MSSHSLSVKLLEYGIGSKTAFLFDLSLSAEIPNGFYKSLTKWIDKFLEGGIQKVTEPISHQVPCRLKPSQQLELKKMLLEQMVYLLFSLRDRTYPT